MLLGCSMWLMGSMDAVMVAFFVSRLWVCSDLRS